jgi:F-type H+-transporting ATPase subunit beta
VFAGVDERTREGNDLIGGSSVSCRRTCWSPSSSPASGSTVPLKETIEAFDKIVKGEFDDVPEQVFFLCGGLEDLTTPRSCSPPPPGTRTGGPTHLQQPL